MRVEMLKSGERGTIEARVHDPLPNAPEWMRIRPDQVGGRIMTLPDDHVFERSAGQFGAPREIVDAARRFLAGDADQTATEACVAEVLTEWSRTSSPPQALA
jgi:hypothetical protein